MATTDRENQLLRTAYAAGITDPRELANFMAQVGHESGGLSRLEEGFRYTQGSWQISANVRSALRQGPEALERARVDALNGRPEHLAELMYGGRVDTGNDAPGDGYRYRGRGYIQLTGKNQYRAAGEALDMDLVGHPELAAQPENAARIATWYWQRNVPHDARDTAREAGAAINGSNPPNGLRDREARFERWQRDLTPELMQHLEQGRLGEPLAPANGRAHASHPPGVDGGFEQVMARMLPAQHGVHAHVTGQYGEHRGKKGPHGGTDFNYAGGQAGINLRHPVVHAPVAGTVTFSGGQYGTVKIHDAQGNSHEILHLDARTVKEGQIVRAGDPIGTMGGRGPAGASQYAQHVHYQLRDPQGHLTSPQTFWDRQSQTHGGHAPAASTTHHAAPSLLQHGDHGSQVRALQRQLNALGVVDAHGQRLTEDGKFGAHTQAAVQRLQRAHGIAVDGEVGPDTRRALARDAQAHATPGTRAHGGAARDASSRSGAAAAASPGLDQPAHPDHRLYAAIRAQLPGPVSNAAAAHVTAQAKAQGIDAPEKIGGVAVRDGTAFVAGTTPGFRATVELAQSPSFEQSSRQLLVHPSQAQAAELQTMVAMQR